MAIRVKKDPNRIFYPTPPDVTNALRSYKTTIPHETFRIYEDGDYWCVGIVCDINKPKQTNADRIRAWNDHELAETIANFVSEIDNGDVRYFDDPNDWLKWLQQTMAKKELDKLSQEMLQCEADGFGVSYGKWKAMQPPYVPPEKEMRVCLFCGKLFEPKSPKQKYCDTVCSVANQEKKTSETSYIHKRNKKVKQVGVTDGQTI